MGFDVASLAAAGENFDDFEVRNAIFQREIENLGVSFFFFSRFPSAARHFFGNVVFCKELNIRFFSQGLLFSLINSISAPGQIPGGKKARGYAKMFFSI